MFVMFFCVNCDSLCVFFPAAWFNTCVYLLWNVTEAVDGSIWQPGVQRGFYNISIITVYTEMKIRYTEGRKANSAVVLV